MENNILRQLKRIYLELSEKANRDGEMYEVTGNERYSYTEKAFCIACEKISKLIRNIEKNETYRQENYV